MEIDPNSAVLTALTLAQRQLAVALWLAGGMVLATAVIGFLAFGWRRAALGAGLLYAGTLCFIPVGPARVLGPCAAAAAAVGLLRPANPSPRR